MKKTLFLIITLCLISLPTKAGIIWTLNDFTMSDGSQFSGFIEVDSGSVIDWDITNNKVYSDSPGYYNTLNSIASMYSTAIMINEKNTN
ncbi:hypothetical protein A3K86_10780 [Photobacterium jeanii]|uniref:Uncharacterized protein n=1 Tax=Photobacterium jeanii TaxID=858640 RepID=A0A178KIA4_9GAMM|nr:hypothetical protein [Photobacterium jeanii]OAN16474.1 hypothetical protein A3K86_10780 [Photobacterium jeanii]PST86073.1 hypothetical protein C9I91_22150 [Photobacterium jeanii]